MWRHWLGDWAGNNKNICIVTEKHMILIQIRAKYLLKLSSMIPWKDDHVLTQPSVIEKVIGKYSNLLDLFSFFLFFFCLLPFQLKFFNRELRQKLAIFQEKGKDTCSSWNQKFKWLLPSHPSSCFRWLQDRHHWTKWEKDGEGTKTNEYDASQQT